MDRLAAVAYMLVLRDLETWYSALFVVSLIWMLRVVLKSRLRGAMISRGDGGLSAWSVVGFDFEW
jgi:hypothetical protein